MSNPRQSSKRTLKQKWNRLTRELQLDLFENRSEIARRALVELNKFKMQLRPTTRKTDHD